MKKSIAMRWADYLEQTGLKQAIGVLDDGKGAKCCLGHLCDMLHARRTLVDDAVYYGKRYDWDMRFLPDYIRDRVGMRSCSGMVDGMCSLAEMNDNGISLKKIAQYIRENWGAL